MKQTVQYRSSRKIGRKRSDGQILKQYTGRPLKQRPQVLHRAVPLADRFHVYLLRVDGEAWKIAANSPEAATWKARRWLWAGRIEVVGKLASWLDAGPKVMERVE